MDETVAKLSQKALILYVFCIPHIDIGGKMYSAPHILKGNVVPLLAYFSTRSIRECLKELKANGLILLYGENDKYMYFKGFMKNQKLCPTKEAPSEIPDPPQELLQSYSEVTPTEVKVNISECKAPNTHSSINTVVDVDNETEKRGGLAKVLPPPDNYQAVDILNHWNANQSIKEPLANTEIYFIIRKALKLYSKKDICEAIDNYGKVLKSEYTYLKHKWSLKEFLTLEKGLKRFVPGNFDSRNFKNWGS